MNSSNTFFPRNLILAAGGMVAFLILWLFFTQTSTAQVYTHNAVQIKEHNNRSIITYSSSKNGLQSFEIEYHGKIDVTDNDQDVRSISPGGYLEISKTTFGSKRSIKIEAESGGKLRRQYFEGRKEMPFELEGKKWLSEILPEIVRTTRIGAESRVNRFYSKGGVNAVLKEIESLESSYVQIYYAELLIEKKGLSKDDLVLIIDRIGKEVDSDYYLATLLINKSSLYLNDQKTSDSYYSALNYIDSDYYASEVLKKALEDNKPSAASMKKALEALNKIGSDYYQTVVISSLLNYENLDGEVLTSLINSSKNISSDYYQSTVLKKALEHKNISPEAYSILLDEIGNVSSDYYMATVYSELIDKGIDNHVKIKIITSMSQKMNSDYYMATVLSKMFKDGNMTDQLSEALLNAVVNMNSDFYASTVITAAAERGEINKKSLLSLIQATTSIDSDFYQSEALSKLAYAAKRLNDDEVMSAYRAAAKYINSDTYYGKAIKAIDF